MPEPKTEPRKYPTNYGMEMIAARVMSHGIKLRKPPEREPNIKCTDIEIVNILRSARNILGRPPKTTDIAKLKAKGKINSPSCATIAARFGSWSQALEAAGITK